MPLTPEEQHEIRNSIAGSWSILKRAIKDIDKEFKRIEKVLKTHTKRFENEQPGEKTDS